MYGYGRKAWDVVAWTYDADVHCPDCAGERFAGQWDFDWTDPDAPTRDSEGNVPCPVFSSDYEGGETCGDCHTVID